MFVLGLAAGAVGVWFGKDWMTKTWMGAEAYAASLQAKATSITATIKKL
jgi:hypothetical protein